MSSLDKHMMYYFRDEMEKQAIIPPGLAQGVSALVGRATAGANKAMSAIKANKFVNNFATRGAANLATGTAKGAWGMTKGIHGGISSGLQAGGMGKNMANVVGGLTTAGVIGAGAMGVNSAAKSFGSNMQQLKQTGPVQQAGIQQL